MASSSIKNWHWRTKSVHGWSREYFEQHLVGLEAAGVTILPGIELEGDAEVGMRKSKLVTIYDEKITIKWKATDSTGINLTGTLVALEVAHDMDEDEYIFQATIDDSESKEGSVFLKLAKKSLGDKLRPLFQKLPKAMLDTHGQDLLANDGDSAPSSGATTPAAVAPTKSTATPSSTLSSAKSTAPAPTSVSGLSFNTSTVKVEGEFQCSAEDLFDFLTNAKKIPLWSRNPAKMAPEVDAPVELFGGNITGKVLEVEKNERIKMDWRVGTWPESYYGQLEMQLKQGTNSTTLILRLTGCPVGMEDATETNLTVYYLNALRSIGSVDRWSLFISSAIPMAISLSLIGALGMAFYYGPSGPGGTK